MADYSVSMAVCPIVGADRFALAHKDAITIVDKNGASTTQIPIGHPVRAIAFVPVAEKDAAASPAAATPIAGTVHSGAPNAAFPDASAYIVSGGDNKHLNLIRIDSAAGTATIVDTHGPVGKKVTHLLVVPTAGSAPSDPTAAAPFPALVAKAPTGIPPYCPNPKGTFATYEAPSVALATAADDKDKEKEEDEEHDDNNVKLSGLSAKDAYAVAAGRYYPNQIANVIFGNKFGEVYVIAILRNAATGALSFGPAPVFLLQHFSVLTTVALFGYDGLRGKQDNSVARLLTCDRDGHVRVSKFPAAFDIEQFLWSPYLGGNSSTANSTAKDGEENDDEGEGEGEGEEKKAERQKQQAPIAALVADFNTTNTNNNNKCVVYAGDASGRVSQWVSELTSSSSSSSSSPSASSSSSTATKKWTLKNIYDGPEAPAGTAVPTNYGGVVGLALLSNNTLIIARDHVSEITAVVGIEKEDGEEEEGPTGVACPVPNGSAVLQLTPTADRSAAIALLRDGSLFLIKPSYNSDDNSNPFTIEPIVNNNSSPVVPAASLASIDLYYAWKSQFAENKTRRDEERQISDERNKTNPKLNKHAKKSDHNEPAVAAAAAACAVVAAVSAAASSASTDATK